MTFLLRRNAASASIRILHIVTVSHCFHVMWRPGVGGLISLSLPRVFHTVLLQTSTLYLISWLLYIFATLILSCDLCHVTPHMTHSTRLPSHVTHCVSHMSHPFYLWLACVYSHSFGDCMFHLYYLWLTVIPYESLSHTISDSPGNPCIVTRYYYTADLLLDLV